MNGADAVNDLAPTGEPSFTPVAICVGSDAIDGGSVTLVNRLCMNLEAARIVKAEIVSCEQQQQEDSAIIVQQGRDLEQYRESNFQLTYASVFMLVVIVVAMVRRVWRMR